MQSEGATNKMVPQTVLILSHKMAFHVSAAQCPTCNSYAFIPLPMSSLEERKDSYSHLLTTVINKFGRICSYSSLFPRPLPDFISQSWRKIELRLRDKIWEWPGNEAIATVLAMYLRPLDYHSFLRAMVLLWNFVCMTIQTKILQAA